MKLKDLSKSEEFEGQCAEINIWMDEIRQKMLSKEIGETLSVTLLLTVEHQRYLNEMDVIETTVRKHEQTHK